MRKKSLALLIGIALILVAVGVVFASQGNKYGRAVTPPFPQPAEKDLQKIIFIRYAPGKEPQTVCGDDICEKKENWKKCPEDCQKPGNGEEPSPTPEPTVCYGFLTGSKPKWNWVEEYYTSTKDLETASALATATWDKATSATIFGSGNMGTYPWGVYDLTNSISYGNYSDPNVIAVTAIWFRGKSIYEYDIMFDNNYFPDGKEVDYDLKTVTLHEFGHGAGLDDLYDTTCVTEVMYGIYDGVDLDLGLGDTIGIKTLYGE